VRKSWHSRQLSYAFDQGFKKSVPVNPDSLCDKFSFLCSLQHYYPNKVIANLEVACKPCENAGAASTILNPENHSKTH
jgi:hypothetical protein